MTYQRQYTARFSKNLGRFQNMRARIKKRVDEIPQDPYQNTERVGKASGAEYPHPICYLRGMSKRIGL